jgi:dihydroorotate dehydrogenase (NAD+) catalytic subunit
MSSGPGPLHTRVAGLSFRNPVVLAAGTAGYGFEIAEVVDLARVGGLVTKAVSPMPRAGATSPRVAEIPGGMINAVGLANPGLEHVREHELRWLAAHAGELRAIVNVVGDTVSDFAAVVAGLDASDGLHAYELNVSCPNVEKGGLEFGADPCTLAEVVRGARRETTRPLFVKLSPTSSDLATAARAAADAGADGITLLNTIPGMVVDVERRRPVLGFGSGGVSGSGLLPVSVLATWRVRQAVSLPIMGVGGVRTATDALQLLIAGASLVGIGTAALRDPRVPERIVGELERWCAGHGVRDIGEIVGTLQWPR